MYPFYGLGSGCSDDKTVLCVTHSQHGADEALEPLTSEAIKWVPGSET